jgi:hypothetical protein
MYKILWRVIMNNLKLMAVKGLLAVDKFYQKNKKKLYSMAAVGAGALTVAMPVGAAEAGAGSSLIDFGTIDLSALTNTISAAIPAALPTVVVLLGARKGISLFTGMIRGA